MNNLFLILILVSIAGLIVGLTKPSTIKLKSRKQVVLFLGGSTILFFILFGVTSSSVPAPTTEPEKQEEQQALNPNDKKVADTVDTVQQNQQATPKIKEVEENKPIQQPPVTSQGKSYQQVFTFSGNGAKKSEPFTITGTRFRIRYDCTGDLCQAFLYRNGKMGGVIMNASGPLKDETIEYGAGEYYIDANTIGSFTMIVEDYR